jgi:hypothetical protein
MAESYTSHDGKMLFQLDDEKTDVSKLADKTEVRFKVNEAAHCWVGVSREKHRL